MDIAFYTARAGAKAQQTRMDTIGNNMANANTTAYKSQDAAFVDLLYSNVRDDEGVNTQLKVGSGIRVEKSDIDLRNGGIQDTGNPTDHMIVGSGFFAVEDPSTNEVFYTRDGAFQHSLRDDGNFYLVTANGELVLNENMERIQVDLSGAREAEDAEAAELNKPGIFDFEIKDGMLLRGDNRFSPVAKNGEPIVNQEAKFQTGYLEGSNVEVSSEFVKLIETQRAYSMALKMVQTSNEIEQTIEGLRGA